MARSHWHIVREGQGLTLCRVLPPRFDVCVETVLPEGDPVRYAHQIRQDLWRKLQRVRGFSPVVQLSPVEGGGWCARVGGRASGPMPQVISEKIENLLSNQAFRTRWARHASLRNTKD